MAVLSGDFLFAKVFELLARYELGQVLQLTVSTIERMCQGEIDQAGDRFNPLVTRERYFQRIYQKTGSLVECSCLAGAMVGGATPEQQELVGRYGRELGVVYQIIDDILDLTGDPQVTGKSAWEDFTQGTLTLPVIMLLEREEEQGWLAGQIAAGNTGEAVRGEIWRRMAEARCIEAARLVAVERIGVARRAIAELPESEQTLFLMELADQLLTRTK